MSSRNYKIIIGFLVVLLIGLNIVKPIMERKSDEKFAASAMSLIDAMQGKDEATQKAYLAQFNAQNRSLAMSASASASACNMWIGMRDRFLMVWTTWGPVQRVNAMSYYNFLEDMVSNNCVDGMPDQIDPLME